MSLGRLLTTGKAFTSLRDLPTSYRMRREALLPKFGAKRDPFTSAPPSVSETQAPRPETAARPESPACSGGWLWKWLRRKPRPTKPENGRRTPLLKVGSSQRLRTPVQGELLLSQVKVARNDLMDADGPGTTRVNGVSLSRVPGAAPLLGGAKAASQALDRLAERITGTRLP